jgi:hypothetical protein
VILTQPKKIAKNLNEYKMSKILVSVFYSMRINFTLYGFFYFLLLLDQVWQILYHAESGIGLMQIPFYCIYAIFWFGATFLIMTIISMIVTLPTILITIKN